MKSDHFKQEFLSRDEVEEGYRNALSQVEARELQTHLNILLASIESERAKLFAALKELQAGKKAIKSNLESWLKSNPAISEKPEDV